MANQAPSGLKAVNDGNGFQSIQGPNGQTIAEGRVSPFTLTSGQNKTISVKEGDLLVIVGAASTAGTVQRIDVNNSVLQSWVIGIGTLANIGSYTGTQRFIISCTTGSTSVSVVNAGVGAAQLSVSPSNLPVIVPPNGSTGVVLNPPSITICEFGASFNELNDRYGLSMSSGVNIAGAVTIYGNLLFPAGNCLLEYQASTSSLRCTPNGETTGAWVPVKDGIFYIPSGSTTNYLKVSIIKRLMPVIDKSDTLTSGTRVWSRPSGSWKGQLSFAMNEQIKWLPSQGIGGSQSPDIAGRMDQVAAQPADLFLMNVSGNDSVTGNVPVATSVSTTLANADVILKTGRPVVLQTLSPRFGKDAAGGNLSTTAEYTVQAQGNLVSCNKGCVSGARLRRMPIADWSGATDPLDSRGAIYNGYTADGKHPAGGLAHVAADANLPILSSMVSWNKYSANLGAGDYYDATYNPGGNLLATNQGAFAGTGGTLNSGCAVTPAWVTSTVYAAKSWVINSGSLYYTTLGGTSGATAPTHKEGTFSDGAVQWTFIQSGVVAGLAAGWVTTIEGAGTTVLAHSYTEKDGTRWQEFIVSGTTADGNAFRCSPTATGNTGISTGDLVVFDYDVQISNPNDCYGLFCDVLLTGGLTVIWDNQSMNGIQQGIKWTSGKMSVEPMPMLSGVTALQPRIHTQSKASGNFRVRYKNASLRKVI